MSAAMSARPSAGILPTGNASSRFIKVSDGVELHCLDWSTGRAAAPWAVLVFIHGIASHAAWFGETAVDLRDAGVAVYAPDRRGSGLSGGPRGHIPSYERALDDVTEILKLAAAEHPDTPTFLAASSWAAKLTIVYAALRSASLSGLILLGPGLFERVNLSPAQQLGVLLGHTVMPTARVPIPLTPELYTTTPRYVEFIRHDPLRLLTATTRFFWETRRLDRTRESASVRLHLPILVLQGDHDAMMDIRKTRTWFSELPLADKTYVSYERAGHTLDFEAHRSQYLADLLGWLAGRVSVTRDTS
jgi:alpha-beta hydrolase superfamily lysophospholipase